MQQVVIFFSDMGGTATHPRQGGKRRRNVSADCLRFVGFLQCVASLIYRSDQFRPFNAVNVDADPAHVEGLNADGTGFHVQGKFHRVTPQCLPVVMSVTAR